VALILTVVGYIGIVLSVMAAALLIHSSCVCINFKSRSASEPKFWTDGLVVSVKDTDSMDTSGSSFMSGSSKTLHLEMVWVKELTTRRRLLASVVALMLVVFFICHYLGRRSSKWWVSVGELLVCLLAAVARSATKGRQDKFGVNEGVKIDKRCSSTGLIQSQKGQLVEKSLKRLRNIDAKAYSTVSHRPAPTSGESIAWHTAKLCLQNDAVASHILRLAEMQIYVINDVDQPGYCALLAFYSGILSVTEGLASPAAGLLTAFGSKISELDDTYGEAMNRIWTQDDEDVKLAGQVLSWISYALRPLTIIEIQHALAVEPGDEDFDEDALPDQDILVSVFAGLVAIDQESNIIRLVHYTTRSTLSVSGPYGSRMLRLGLQRLALRISHLICLLTAHAVATKNSRFGCINIPSSLMPPNIGGDHARGEVEEKIEEPALKFLKHESKVICFIQVLYLLRNQYFRNSQNFPYHVNGLHIAAFTGLSRIAQLLLEHEGIYVNYKNSYGYTPLLWAVKNGRETVVKLLLKHKGIDVNSKDNSGSTPLAQAAEIGNETLVKLLLEHKGINVNSKDIWGATLLLLAAATGYEEVVRLLLEHKGIDPNIKDYEGRDPLWWAACGQHEAVVQLLLEREDIHADSGMSRQELIQRVLEKIGKKERHQPTHHIESESN
jgi:Ankyrin repeats (3 copies)/Ankyrin repeats (many copies)